MCLIWSLLLITHLHLSGMWFDMVPRAVSERHVSKHIGLHVQIVIIILDSLVNIIGKTYMTTRIYTWTMNKLGSLYKLQNVRGKWLWPWFGFGSRLVLDVDGQCNHSRPIYLTRVWMSTIVVWNRHFGQAKAKQWPPASWFMKAAELISLHGCNFHWLGSGTWMWWWHGWGAWIQQVLLQPIS